MVGVLGIKVGFLCLDSWYVMRVFVNEVGWNIFSDKFSLIMSKWRRNLKVLFIC